MNLKNHGVVELNYEEKMVDGGIVPLVVAGWLLADVVVTSFMAGSLYEHYFGD